jgi:signal peptidase II
MLAWIHGRMTGLGLAVAALSALADQASKYWLLFIYNVRDNGPFDVGPFAEITLVWNRGVSYGLFQQETPLGSWGLISFRLLAVVFLVLWLAKASTRTSALAIGLLIGGAIGNGIDGVLHQLDVADYQGVVDFVHLHVADFNWYVFNIADVAIVAGVALLLYDVVLNKEPRASLS